MSSDAKIPEWAMDEAVAFEKDLPSKITGTNRVFIRAVLARALLAAEQRGRKAGLEEAAKVAEKYRHKESGFRENEPDKTVYGWGEARREITAAIRSLGEKI